MPTSLKSIRALIIDLDGVLWRGKEPLPGVAAFFGFLNAHALAFLLATNNATRRAKDTVARLAAMGIHVPARQVSTSADATARWLTHALPAGARVFVIGEAALREELAAAGLTVAEDNVAAVVVGLDRGFTYEKLRRAAAEIRAGARFIATNGDQTFPAENGLVPGAGALVAAVQAATSVTPTVIGKPHRPLFDLALDILQTPRAATAMLGDRLDTDIEGAHAAGLTTLLVLTGVTTADEAAAARVKPDYVFADLPALIARWEKDLAH